MGLNMATELADGTLGLDMAGAIAMHLRANHYPPVPTSMVEPCMDAIDAYWEDDLYRQIELPEGISWRGETTAPAYAIIEAHHLEPWCTESDYDEDALI
jgi:hypothetical protein